MAQHFQQPTKPKKIKFKQNTLLVRVFCWYNSKQMPIKKTLTPFFLSALLYLSLPLPTHAATWGGDCVKDEVATIKGIQCLVLNLTEPLPYLIGLMAFIMIIFAGARIISAGADAKALSSAWSQFQWAIIGIILLSVAWLVLLTIKAFTGADVTSFGFN